MLTANQMWGAEECGICEEELKITDSDIVEMVNPTTNEHVICHHSCGKGKGMVLA